MQALAAEFSGYAGKFRYPIAREYNISGTGSSITLLSICLPTGYFFRKIAGHGVECQAMAAKY